MTNGKRTTPRTHGTHACYVHGEWGDRTTGGCRCAPCTRANFDYEQARAARTQPPYVSALPAREHITWLATQGVGLKQIAKTSGISHGALWKIIYGAPSIGRPPSRRIRPDTHNKILAVTPADGADGSRVPAGPVLEMVDRLVAAGIPRVRIAERIGQTGPGLQLGTTLITRRHARAIEAMAAELDNGTLVTARRSRNGSAATINPPAADEQPDPQHQARDHVILRLVEILEARIDENHWRKQAACTDKPTWMFFPSRGDVTTLAAARKICGACFVRTQCLQANLEEKDGIYGGLSAHQRRDLRHDRRQAS